MREHLDLPGTVGIRGQAELKSLEIGPRTGSIAGMEADAPRMGRAAFPLYAYQSSKYLRPANVADLPRSGAGGG